MPQTLRNVIGEKDSHHHLVEALLARVPMMTDASVVESPKHHMRTLLKGVIAKQDIGNPNGCDALRIAATCRALGAAKKWVLL